MARLDDRGQMLLIGAVTIAVLFVSLSIVMSGNQHTPTVSGEASSDVSMGETASLHASIRQNTLTLMERAQAEHPGPGDDTQRANFVANNLTLIGETAPRYYAEEDRVLSIEADDADVIHGTERTDVGLDEVDGTDETIVDDRFRRFELETPSSGDFDNPIELEVGTERGTFDVNVNDVHDPMIRVEDPDDVEHECDHSPPTSSTVDFADATIDGEPCDALDVLRRAVPDEVVVESNENGDGDVMYTKFEAGDGDEDIYGVVVTVNERTPTLHYVRTIRVVPGEPR